MHDELTNILRRIARPAIAVSGGVDSVTLAGLTTEVNDDVLLMHAVSPAVPPEATLRLRQLARTRAWNLVVIEAGEFTDPAYLANPANRCFFCKSNLYSAIRSKTERQILSGANTDDLGEYRPGLVAAQRHDVRHPFVEACITKAMVREFARELALVEVAELPASPCLSSRIETGIRIEPALLEFVHSVETLFAATLEPKTIRCRIRATAVVIELDLPTFAALSENAKRELEQLARTQPNSPRGMPVRFEPYRNGSAFLLEATT